MKKILIFNHKAKACGVHQYGLRTANILKKSTKYDFIYCEADAISEFWNFVNSHNPDGIIYNFYGGTLSWLNGQLVSSLPRIKHYSFHHEGSLRHDFHLNYHIDIDSTAVEHDNIFSIPRPLIEGFEKNNKSNDIPVIGSFGFPAFHKRFREIVKLANDQFDEAIIHLHTPMAFFRDHSRNILDEILAGCRQEVKKGGIQLISSTNFLSDEEILQFLGSNDINVFLYDDMNGCGLSSVIDFALSANKPIAIRKSDMFRHINKTIPSICVEDVSLPQIINYQEDSMQQYRDKWSNANLIKKMEDILDETL
jgi:hypothetical protein